MAKRKSDGSGIMVVIVIIATAISSATEWVKIHQEQVIGIIGLIICFFILKMILNRQRYKKRVIYLKNKYNNNMEIVNAIIKGQFWQGQSSEQLLDSLGHPDAIDRQVLKTKTKEVWKYDERRKNQFSLKIILEKGNVVGWEKRG